jgi:hypothetical protein
MSNWASGQSNTRFRVANRITRFGLSMDWAKVLTTFATTLTEKDAITGLRMVALKHSRIEKCPKTEFLRRWLRVFRKIFQYT